jgi:hypothetical protein
LFGDGLFDLLYNPLQLSGATSLPLWTENRGSLSDAVDRGPQTVDLSRIPSLEDQLANRLAAVSVILAPGSLRGAL